VTSTELVVSVISPIRTALEVSADFGKDFTKTLADQVDLIFKMPETDLSTVVDQYFGFVRQTVDANRDFALAWAAAANSLLDTVREQLESAGKIGRERIEALSSLAREQVGKSEHAVLELVAAGDEHKD